MPAESSERRHIHRQRSVALITGRLPALLVRHLCRPRREQPLARPCPMPKRCPGSPHHCSGKTTLRQARDQRPRVASKHPLTSIHSASTNPRFVPIGTLLAMAHSNVTTRYTASGESQQHKLDSTGPPPAPLRHRDRPAIHPGWHPLVEHGFLDRARLCYLQRYRLEVGAASLHCSRRDCPPLAGVGRGLLGLLPECWPSAPPGIHCRLPTSAARFAIPTPVRSRRDDDPFEVAWLSRERHLHPTVDLLQSKPMGDQLCHREDPHPIAVMARRSSSIGSRQ